MSRANRLTLHTQGDSSTKLLNFKTFTFVDEDLQLVVKVPEVAEASYGMYTWPCAPVLAQYVFKHRKHIQGQHVLEIGSGTALAGVVAAKCGAKVTLSDSAIFPDCIKNSQASCHANDLDEVKVIPLTWGLVTPALLHLPTVSVILGSDCFYDTKDFEAVLVSISFLLKRNPTGQFWCTYQNRSAMRSIEFYLQKWKLHAREVETKSFIQQADNWNNSGSDSVHMFIITLHTNPQFLEEVT